MKIVVVNKFYYPRGGDCVCAINQERLLLEKGHEVIFFSMKYPANQISPTESYFPEQVSFSGALSMKIRAIERLFSPKDVATKFSQLIDNFHPDVVHLHNIHSYLSPIIGKIAHKKGIRVIWTLHDYKLICPSYTCLCNKQVCEQCFIDSYAILKNKCMKDSFVASCLSFLEAKYWNKRVLQGQTNCFVCPSQFMYDKMKQSGFNPAKLQVISNFVDTTRFQATSGSREDYYCYIGRVSEEKGVETLLSVAASIGYSLKVIGDGPLLDRLKEKYASFPQISFLGYQPLEVIKEFLSRAKFSVLCSEWYENNPMGVIESLCMGTPVLGANIGGIPELLDENNGIIFKSKNKQDLRRSIYYMFEKKFNYLEIQERAFKRFSKEIHYKQLMGLYQSNEPAI